MKRFFQIFLFFVSTQIEAAIGELSQAESRRMGFLFSESSLTGHPEIKERVQVCKHLEIPYEHIVIPFQKFGSGFNFEKHPWPFWFRTSSLPFREEDAYEFHFYFSKEDKAVDLKGINFSLVHDLTSWTDLFFSETRIKFNSLTSDEWKQERTENGLKKFSYEITSNPFKVAQKLYPKSRFKLSLKSCQALSPPDCVEVLVHVNINDFFTRKLHQENHTLASDLDDTRAELEDLKTHVKTLTLQMAAERSFDSVTNTTVSSLRSTQNNTPTNGLGDDT